MPLLIEVLFYSSPPSPLTVVTWTCRFAKRPNSIVAPRARSQWGVLVEFLTGVLVDVQVVCASWLGSSSRRREKGTFAEWRLFSSPGTFRVFVIASNIFAAFLGVFWLGCYSKRCYFDAAEPRNSRPKRLTTELLRHIVLPFF